jgi:hypothetical protein
MFTMEKSLSLDLEDLKNLTIDWARCKSRILMNLESTSTRIPNTCPCCGNEFGNASAQSPRAHVKDALRLLSAISHRVTFQTTISWMTMNVQLGSVSWW